MKTTRYLFLFLMIMTFTACSPAVQTPDDEVDTPGQQTVETAVDDETSAPADDVYPAPKVTITASDTYPAPVEMQQYDPYPEPASSDDSLRFMIDKPVLVGATEVTGRGPAGVPIMLVDVTLAGEPIALSVIASDGTFRFTVPAQEANHRIGIALGNLSGTGWTETDFQDPKYNGDQARTVPTIGFFFDTALVREP
ncbi:MAG: hypothetical protein JW862_16235 [Anaerolineales bacterium]|nr:hypothetical protein [Anaerolineales bacterium]